MLSVEFDDLIQILCEVFPNNERSDTILCPLGSSNLFSVNSCYDKLLQNVGEIVMTLVTEATFVVLWKTKILLKVKVFGWRLIWDRLVTWNNIVRRGIISNPHENVCVFCFNFDEDIHHVFVTCPQIKLVWENILVWVGFSWIHEETCSNHLLAWFVRMCGICSKKYSGIIWLAICWCIWWSRNQIIFNNEIGDPNVIVERIIIFSRWLSFRSKHKVRCNYYEWFKSAIDYL